MKRALAVLSVAAVGVLGLAGPASAQVSQETHHGFDASGNPMVSSCEVHASYQVCGYWEYDGGRPMLPNQ